MSVSSTAQGWRPGVTTSTTRPVTPYVGQTIYETDSLQAMVWNGTLWVPLSQGTNVVINGGFDIWQRTAATFTTTNEHNADRWRTFNTGDTFVVSRQAFALGSISGYEPRNYQRTVITAVAGAANYLIDGQRIESVRTLAGQVATISFWAKSSVAGKQIAAELAQNFGTGGSPSGETYALAGKFTLTTSWARYAATVTIPSLSGKTMGTVGDDFLGLYLWLDAGSNYNARTGTIGQLSATVDVWGVQLEAGTGPSPFEWRQPSEVLAMCQRYYYAPFYGAPGPSYAGFNGGHTASNTTLVTANITLPVTMRIGPTYVSNGAAGSDFILTDRIANVQCTSVTTVTTETIPSQWVVSFGTAGSLVAGRYYQPYRFNNTIQPALSAEL